MYDKDISRAKRYLIYYLKIHILLALTALVSRDGNQLYSLLVSLVCAIFLGVPTAIIKALLKKDKKLP